MTTGVCPACGARIAKYCSNAACEFAHRAHRLKRLRPLPHATHIAGYVPPKGSIALQLLGRVIQLH